ncbi:MAG: hypothetical protein ACLFO2_00240 [Candidatus Woesearchaeota archaeon]
MADKVARVGVRKERGYLYFVDKQGDVSKAPMVRGGKGAKGRAEKVARANVRKEPGYLYFVDKDGDISKAKMARGRA